MEEIKCYVHCAEQLQESTSDTSEISTEEKCRARCITSDHILEDYIYRFTESNTYDRHDTPATTTTVTTTTSSTTNVYCLLGIVGGVVFLTIVLISFYKKCRVK